ncbi:hypothetical protein [Mangrovicoccus sp. HB161399]|uniref:hypothetical protein n=1 Tax=Mangrovicoccus sp. HB161399 TaxID=2720392 RepID=UPI00155336D6|nr:hypothetical protein [Mangrovicoccus sp. HB161399]
MKKFALAATLAVAASASFAGGLEEPIVEPEVIVEETSGTGAAWIIPVLLLAVVAAVAVNG